MKRDRREYSKAYREANKEMLVEKQKARYQLHKERIRAEAALKRTDETRKQDALKKAEERRTVLGYLKSTYSNMRGRVKGTNTSGPRWGGLSLCSLDEFLSWASTDQTFLQLFEAWKAAGGGAYKISPSLDRKDSSIGYEITNLQWLSQSEHSKKTNAERWAA